MAKSKKKSPSSTFEPPTLAMDKMKLFDLLQEQNFGSIEEANEFFEKNINGKQLQEIIPKKKGKMSKKEKSESLVYKAYESDEQDANKLMREALLLDPENVNALIFLGDQESNNEVALILYAKATAAGSKSLGTDFFEENTGHFWLMHETRPFMTAKFNYAMCLYSLERYDEAIESLEDLLELNPNDNQGARYELQTLYLLTKRYDDYFELYKQFDGEIMTGWLMNHSFFLYVTIGPAKKAKDALKVAFKQNPYIVSLLKNPERIEKPLGEYITLGGEDEARNYLLANFMLWASNENAVQWLLNSILTVR